MLTRNAQVNHSELGEAINAFNPNLWIASPDAASGNLTALAQLDGLVTNQAMMISYIDDFWLMTLVTLSAIPLALFLRKPKAAPVGPAPAVHAE